MKHLTQTLCKQSGKTGIIVSIMLISSVIFNIAALYAPFYTAKVFLKAPYTFTLPHSVLIMWNHNFHIIAILIFSFSIVFPFVKLVILFYAWFFSRKEEFRENLITLVGPLGKWSMLDIFVTIILIVMTNDQFLITSSLKIGVYFFLLAIFLSMTSALRLEVLMFAKNIKTMKVKRLFIRRIENISYTRRIFVFILLLVSMAALIMAINLPIIKINDFFFSDNEYSILTSGETLWNTSKALSFFVFFTLILCPLIHIGGLIVIWVEKLKPRLNYKIERFIHIVSAFNMLDVFCLALVIFITEGAQLIITKERNGLYLLAIFLFCAYLIPIFIKGTHKNYIQFIKNQCPKKTLPSNTSNHK